MKEKRKRDSNETQLISSGPSDGGTEKSVKKSPTNPGREKGHLDKAHTYSRLNVLGQLKRCNSVGAGKKRKVLDTSIDGGKYGDEDTGGSVDPTAFVITTTIEAIVKNIQDLDKRVIENPSTKREIKEIAAKLKKCSDAISKETCRTWFEKHRWESIPVLRCNAGSQTRQDPVERDRKSAEAATQTDGSRWQTERQTGRPEPHKAAEREEVRDLQGYDSLEKWKEIVERKWNPEVYRKTEIMHGGEILNTQDDVVVVTGLAQFYPAQLNPAVFSGFFQ